MTTYIHKMECGSGRTIINLTINDGNRFTMEYVDKWMGQPKINFTSLSGNVSDNQSFFPNYQLYTLLPVGDTTSGLETIDLVVLETPVSLNYIDDEESGIVMGGLSFNKGDRMYDSIIRFNYKTNYESNPATPPRKVFKSYKVV